MKICNPGCKSQRQLDETAPCALEYGNGEKGGDQKGRRRGVEERASVCDVLRPMATGLSSVLMLIRRAAAFAKMRPTFPVQCNATVERRAFVLERILVGLRCSEEAVVIIGFPMSLKEKKT